MSLPYDLSKTGRVASIFLLAYMAAELLFTWHSFQLFGFYDAIDGNLLSAAEMDAEAARIDGTGIFVAGVFLIALIGSYIASGMWIYRAASNAQAVTPNPEVITPGWAVGWYFVPFANFVMPYKAMRQTWDGLVGSGGRDWPSWAIIWWLLWVATTVIAGVSNNINFNAYTIEDFRTGTTLDVVSSLTAIPAAFLFRKLILEMTAISAEARPASSTPDLEEGQL
ncbi:DUF4328 domain-containing protein [Gymnodinialimonas hymeniacidonis]|uniref:DUF4328 domain-containing protein n=1 Tax=Gymnodinialimonas hymeniacidonis TaxID=3126508 RepID=UPI0034C5DCC9